MLVAWWLGCTSPAPLVEQGLPARAPATVLLAVASETEVDVVGTVVSEQTVDLDAPSDTRDGFRYQIVDAADQVLYERTTNGPMVVQAFLGFYSRDAGTDLLTALPGFGAFPLHVPLLEGGDRVRFQLRDAAGVYQDAGEFDLDLVEQVDRGVLETVTNTTTLHSSGPSDNRMDLAILGDGYTEAEMGLFAEHADQVVEELRRVEPYRSLMTSMNIHRIDVPSAESGASYDMPGVSGRSTAFGSIFAVEAVNRLTGRNYASEAVFQLEQFDVARAASHVPWDTALVLVNSQRFGGLAVHVASATTDRPTFARTAVHELGHSFGLLGDEYVNTECVISPRLGLHVNITDRAESPPWLRWVDPETPLPSPPGTPGTGAHQGAYNCDDLYRPAESCIMKSSGGDSVFCEVCTEQLVRRFYRHMDPLDRIDIEDGRATAVGDLPGVTVVWSREGVEFARTAPGESVEIDGPFDVEAAFETDDVRVGDDLVESWSFR